MSQLLDFYRGRAADTQGRMLSDIWQWDDDEWEFCHDFIQWLFPLDVASAFNPNAPLLTRADQRVFKSDDRVRDNMQRSFIAWTGFLGLTTESVGPDGAVKIVKGLDFEDRKSLWAHSNHNWLRITRVLKSLRLCGLETEAKVFFDCLVMLHAEGFVSEHSFGFWRDAMV